MNILLIMDPGIPVPPIGYGGHERLVHMFAKEYLLKGHTVELLVSKGSSVEGCKVHSIGPEGLPSTTKVKFLAILKAWIFLLKYGKSYHLIHNFGRLIYLMPILYKKTNKIMTYGREINSRNIRIINKLPNRNLIFTGCSENLISRVNAGGKWTVVYNAISFSQYSPNFVITDHAPLIFLGRLERVKGVHIAISIAKKANLKLIIAGNKSTLSEEVDYFENEIKPHIDDVQIRYIGTVDDVEKNELLRNARALLFPIGWNEPFGMVMVEAMACGTPVIGFNLGSVAEVVDEGITGFKVKNEEEMLSKISLVKDINRENCFKHARKRYDVDVIADKYLQLF